MVEPELPASSSAEGARSPLSPTPWMVTSVPFSSICAPRARMQPRVEWRSAPVEKFWILETPSAMEAIMP